MSNKRAKPGAAQVSNDEHHDVLDMPEASKGHTVLRAPANVSSVSLHGKEIKIEDGFLEVLSEHAHLFVEQGFGLE